MLLFLYLGCTTNQRCISFGYLLVQVIRALIFVLGSQNSWRRWWSRRQGVRRYHNSWYTDTLGGHCDHVTEICLLHWWSFFFWGGDTKQNLLFWDLHAMDYQDFWIMENWRKGILLYYVVVLHIKCVCTIHCICLNIVNCLVHSNFKYVQRGWECWELCIHFPTYLHGNFTFT